MGPLGGEKMLEKEVVLVFADFNKPFQPCTDASNQQLDATVVQDSKPLGFHMCKLNSAQMNHTVGKKESLGIQEA